MDQGLGMREYGLRMRFAYAMRNSGLRIKLQRLGFSQEGLNRVYG